MGVKTTTSCLSLSAMSSCSCSDSAAEFTHKSTEVKDSWGLEVTG